jgi:murein DD-endopeptidase MepM/ murein hydrolase activator NlpD
MNLPPPQPPVQPLVLERAYLPAAHNWLPAHRGVDLRAAPGQEVRSPVAGRVVHAGRVADRHVVSVRSGGVRLTFEPVAPSVGKGRRVHAGTLIGHVGHGGHCSARCVHFGVKVDGGYRDPMPYLLKPRIVLKPPGHARGWAFW